MAKTNIKNLDVLAAPGMGPLSISNLTFNNGKKLNVDFHNSITNVLIQRTIKGASTLTIQVSDPFRHILNSGVVKQGVLVEIPDGFGNYLQFAFVQAAKASDQLQLVFESRHVYDLRNVRGVLKNASSFTDAGAFVKSICNEHKIPFVGPVNNPNVHPTAYSLGSGTSYNPEEDAWTSFQRVAGTLGWRCWESGGVIFFGPDEYWFSDKHPPANAYYRHNEPILKEFGTEIQLMDYDWDVGGPFGDLSITCMANFWRYNPGEIIQVTGLGPANGRWMVSGMQRDFFNPQGTVTCTIPMPAAIVLTPPTLPVTTGRFLK